jgi:adenylate cyclase
MESAAFMTKRTETKSEENSLIYENVLESMSNGVLALDFEGKIIIFNQALAEIVHLEKKNVLGKYFPEVFTDWKNNSEFLDIMIKVIHSEVTNETHEIVYRRSDSSTVPLGITCSYLKDSNGKDYGIVSVIADLSEIKKREFLQDTLTRYVTKQVVEKILDNPHMINLDGEERCATVMFTDIRGFTGMVESMNPIELVKLLRAYFILMVGTVFQYNGTLDKFIGDSIMAVFGAPVECDNHAEQAVLAALEMKKLLETFNETRAEIKKELLDVGIGICTGDVIVGNLGSPERFEYTAIGDTVNLASRVEGANRYYGTYILINESTRNVLSDEIVCREIDQIRVKGRKKPVVIYEVVEIRNELSSEQELYLNIYNEGLDQFKNCRFDDALKSFNKARSIVESDVTINMYIERCRNYIKNPPSKYWKRVFDLPYK